MLFIVIFDPKTEDPALLQDENLNAKEFNTLEEAIEEADVWKELESCQSYSIYQKVYGSKRITANIRRS